MSIVEFKNRPAIDNWQSTIDNVFMGLFYNLGRLAASQGCLGT